ncbi:MAG: MMPL family transporter [Thermodesulfobacteriota bacterium]
MFKIRPLLYHFFDRVILGYPRTVILCLTLFIAVLGYYTKDFKIDASSETLIKQSDESFRYAREISLRYGVTDFLFLSYTPEKDLLSDDVLNDIGNMRDELRQLERVESVITILDVPLLESPPVPVKELSGNIRTLTSPDVDRSMARAELANSALYQDLLVSPDLKTTSIQVTFKPENRFYDLVLERDRLADKKGAEGLTDEESNRYKKVLDDLDQVRKISDRQRHQDIAAIRAIIAQHQKNARIFLGGISMIADDMIRFVKNDLKIFGTGVFFFLTITLALIFRGARWVVLPMLCCFYSAVAILGLLGFFGWKVTVVSSNFISLQLIISMTYTIHLVVRYRELQARFPDDDQHTLCSKMIQYMLIPTFYGALTTVVGFESLILCDLVPVATFGWMMSAGITVSLLVTFLLFPAALMLLKKTPLPPEKEARLSFTPALARFTENNKNLILVAAAVIVLLSYVGISRLEVENSFINYFKKSTEIYQGMKVIDQELGGTTPLDIIVKLETTEEPGKAGAEKTDQELAAVESDDAFEDFEEFDDAGKDDKYWFTAAKMEEVLKIHDYLESVPEIGKVLSLGTMMKIARKFNEGKPLDNFTLSLLYTKLPEEFRGMVLTPYVSIPNNEVRFSVRIKDSEPNLRRNELIQRISRDLTGRLGLKSENVHLTGMLVLYNNMLQSLFSSQFSTLGTAVLVMMCMYIVLFRSLRLSVIAIAPNLFSIGAILGFMGWAGLPLDMMTITIASISVSIADDNIIQYICRFMEEIKTDGSYIAAMHRCHASIGYDMYYTTITLAIGFSILALSNFIPSILFGLLTSLVMIFALFASLTFLPVLIVLFKPFGPGEPAKG